MEDLPALMQKDMTHRTGTVDSEFSVVMGMMKACAECNRSKEEDLGLCLGRLGRFTEDEYSKGHVK